MSATDTSRVSTMTRLDIDQPPYYHIVAALSSAPSSVAPVYTF